MPTDISRRHALKQLVTTAIAVPVLASHTPSALAASAPIYTPRFSNLALSGYDAVAYFKSGKAKKGSPSLSLEHQGVTWRFVNQRNLDDFVARPEAYEPQYGGYCAFSITKDKLVKGDPELWAIEQGRLFINFNKGIHRLWLARKDALIAKADENWPAILG